MLYNSDCRSVFFVEKDNECLRDSELVQLCEIAETTYYASEFFDKEFVDAETKHETDISFDSKFDKTLCDLAEEVESKAMDMDEDNESDSTVMISDFYENPEKIARKRRKLDASIRNILHANTHVASDVENTAPNVSSVNLPIDRQQDSNDDPGTKQWRINKFLGDCNYPVDSNNDSMVEDLRVKKELLKQENYSQEREGSGDKEVKEDFVVISDDSDDDCTIVTDDTNRLVDKNTNLNPRIGVLTPSDINTRRATLDSFERNETVSNITDSVMSANPNNVNPKLTVLKPSAINSRRATLNSFERNEATSTNLMKHVNFSSDDCKNKKGNDNIKRMDTANKLVNEKNGLSGYKSYGEHPSKLATLNQNVISRKRNSDGVIQGKPTKLQAENIILSLKSNAINNKEIAAVVKSAKQNKSTDSSSVVHSKSDVFARNIQEMSEIRERLETGVVNSIDPNKIDVDRDKTALKNTIDNVCKDVTVTKNNDINGNVNQSEDAKNRVKDQTAISSEISVDIGEFDNSRQENENSTNRCKSTDARRISVDRNCANVSCSTVVSNTNSAENPILQKLKNIMEQNIAQEELTDVLEDIAKVNKQLSNVSKSANDSRNKAEIQTPNKEALCSSTFSHSNSLENPVIDLLKKLIKGDEVFQTETLKCSKSDEQVNKLNYEQSERGVDHDQEINLNQIAEADNRGEQISCNKAYKHVTEFQISFFRTVKEYLTNISQNGKLASQLRASTRILKREVKHILHDVKKRGLSEVRYACPVCSQISVYSPKAMYQIGKDENPIPERMQLKCKSCRGLQILHNTHMQIYLQNISDKNCDEKNAAAESTPENTPELPSTENNNVAIDRNYSDPAKSTAATSTPSMSIKSNKNEFTNLVDGSLAAKNVKTATSGNNDVPIKTSQSQNKNRTSCNEKSRQSYPTVCSENDETTSGNDKTKSYKRTADNNRSPINPKRAFNDSNTPSAILSSLLNEPTTSNNSDNKIISNSNTIYNKESKLRNYEETVTLNENKAQLTQTLVGCFTKFQTRENYENTETANVHTCPVCTCVFGSHTSLIEHMRDDHNIPEKLNTITCPLCKVNLNETNYMAHVKVHFPDENTEVVGTQSATEKTNSGRDFNTTDANSEQHNELKVAKSSEGKQYECKICEEVLYSSAAAKKHRKLIHGHLPLKNKKLFIVTENQGVGLKSVYSQSSAGLGNAVSEDKNSTSGNGDEIANLETVRLGSYEMNEREDVGKNEINKDATKTQDFVEKGSDYKHNFNNSKSQMNVAQTCDESIDNQKKTNQERKRKASNENVNVVQEAKRVNMIKSRGENKIKGHENEDYSSGSHTIDGAQFTTKTNLVIKLRKTSKDVDVGYDNLQSHAETITEPLILHESNSQGGICIVAESSCQPGFDETEKLGEINDLNMDSTEDSNKKSISADSFPENNSVGESSKLPDADSSQNANHVVYPQAEDEVSREKSKSQCIFPATSGRNPILANCYNCRTNIDVIETNNHDCRQKIVGTLYNCYSCGVSVPHDDTHKCENEDNNFIGNIQITKIVTVIQVYVFKCDDCNSATEVYDDVIRHCQNHYNGIEDPIAFCKTCRLSYNIDCFETHKHLHEKDMKLISYSYKSLFSNWNRTFEDMPSDVVEEMQARSIYTSHCVKMRILKEGPWQYTLYQCNQCETCVPPGRVDQHCLKQCYFVAYPCSVCRKPFTSYPMCARHELDHKTTELFKIIEFNCKKDECFNFKLFEARKIEMEYRIPIADIFKCLCGLFFTSNDSFKKHFASCDFEDKGVLCSRCAIPRLFDANELDNHLRLHHSSVAYRFRVNSIVIQQDIETCDALDRDSSRAEDDVKREWLEEENSERSV